MEYKSYSYNLNSGCYLLVDNISEKNFKDIKYSLEDILNISNEMDYWILIENNILHLKNEYCKLGCGQKDNFIIANRELINFLSSFYLWKTFHNHCCKDFFSNMLKAYREKYIECYIIEALRNSSAHDGFLIGKITYDVIKNESNISIDPEIILNKMENKESKNYLQRMIDNNEKICVNKIIDDFLRIYPYIQTEIWKKYEGKVHEDLKLLFSFVPNNNPDLYNTYIESYDDKFHLNIGHILEKFIVKSKEYYPNFLNYNR